MASKSKRRRRVLGASCILAALIVASSSFAWFTSKDEVTNRLSANADYGVSIVESFAPPANWLPGQTVNKDVYATNTGSVAAYVKESVSGTLTITTEKDTTEKTEQSIKLTEEERYVMEAGAYLAYAPADSQAEVGRKIVVRPKDASIPKQTDFAPDAEGLYVFRRVIKVAADTTETFEYAGYYFDGTDFYKITNLTYALANATDNAGDNIQTDGNLASAQAGFAELETKVIEPTKLEYINATTGSGAARAAEAGLERGDYLLATYDTGSAKSEANLKALAAAYDAAIHDMQYAMSVSSAAAAAANTADAETQDKLQALQEKEADYNDAVLAFNAAKGVLDAATVTKTNADARAERAQAVVDELTPKVEAAQQAVADAEQAITDANYTSDAAAFEAELQAFWTDDDTAITEGDFPGADQLTVEQLEAFKAWIGTDTEQHNYYSLCADKLIADYNLANAQSELTRAQDNKSAADTAVTNATQALEAAQQDYNDKQDAMNTAGDAYRTALNEYTAALRASNGADAALEEATNALEAATAARQAAQDAYDQAVEAGLSSDGSIRVWIKLANVLRGVPGHWSMIFSGTTNKADFYWNNILESEETTAKLIDSVTLDKRVTQDVYENFDFDLNIELNSVQINYAEDGKTILADGTGEVLGATATLQNPTNINTLVNWAN